MITQRYNLNLIPDKVPVIVNCSQYDALSRTIEMVIYDGSTVYEIPSGTSASVRGTKQDNTGFEYVCTIDGSVVSFDIQDQMTIFAGKVPCEIRLSKDGGIIGTCNFLLNVEETPLDPDVTISETDLPLLEEAEQNAIRAEQARDEAEELLSSVVKSVNGETPDANGNVDVQKMDYVSSPTAYDILLTDANGQAIDSGRTLSEFQELLTAGTGIDITNGVVTNQFSALPTGTDLNTITYNYSGYVSSAVNSPTGYVSGMLSVIGSTNNNCMQVFHFYNGNKLFVRYYRSATGWGDWREIQYATVTTYSNSAGTIKAWKQGNIVMVRVYHTADSEITLTSSWNTLGTLPTEFRPPYRTDFVLINNKLSTNHARGARVQTNGNIDYYADANYDNGVARPTGSVTFFVE